MRIVHAFALVFCAATAVMAGGVKHYGQTLSIKDETRISDILANPGKFQGKKVRVRGIITNICPDRGCFLNIKGDQKFQELMFKVDEGVLVFPVSAQGSEAVAEGIVTVEVFSEKAQKEMCSIEAKALNRKFDPAKIKGPVTVVRLRGLGADIRG